MPEFFLLAVKVAFLVVLYLFVARAVRAVILDVYGPRAQRRRPPRPPARPAPAPGPVRHGRRAPRELVVVDASGRRTVPLGEEVTVGRAASCDVVVNDTYVSNVHARIFRRDGTYWIEDLGSTNGTYMNRAKVAVPTVVGPGDEIRLGKATLELRR